MYIMTTVNTAERNRFWRGCVVLCVTRWTRDVKRGVGTPCVGAHNSYILPCLTVPVYNLHEGSKPAYTSSSFLLGAAPFLQLHICLESHKYSLKIFSVVTSPLFIMLNPPCVHQKSTVTCRIALKKDSSKMFYYQI